MRSGRVSLITRRTACSTIFFLSLLLFILFSYRHVPFPCNICSPIALAWSQRYTAVLPWKIIARAWKKMHECIAPKQFVVPPIIIALWRNSHRLKPINGIQRLQIVRDDGHTGNSFDFVMIHLIYTIHWKIYSSHVIFSRSELIRWLIFSILFAWFFSQQKNLNKWKEILCLFRFVVRSTGQWWENR